MAHASNGTGACLLMTPATSLPSLKGAKEWRLDWLLAAGFIALSVFARPYEPLRANSGQYLVTVAGALDPGLFPGDPFVAGLSRFGSAYYLLLADLFGALRVAPQNLPGVMFWVLVGLKLAQAAGLVWFWRSMKADRVAKVIVVAWATVGTQCVLGGNSLFDALPIHAELALAVGLFAMGCLLRGQVWPFWLLTGSCLFVHSIMAVQLVLGAAPVACWLLRAQRRALLLGMGVFGLFFAGYVVVLNPPAFTPEEATIFLGAKTNMVHISPAAQSPAAWLRWALLTVLVVMAFKNEDAGSAKGFLLRIAVCGSVAGLGVGAIALATGWLRPAQLQPMRTFYWVTLALYALLSLIVAEQFRDRKCAWPVLMAGLVFDVCGSLWAYPFLGLSAAVLGLEQSHAGRKLLGLLCTGSRLNWTFVAASVLLALAWFGARFASYESLKSPVVLGVAAAFAVSGVVRSGRVSGTAALAMLACTLVAGSCGHSWLRHWRKLDSDWTCLGKWCAANTSKGASFLTPVVGDNFRVHSLRSSLNEDPWALVWVAPLAYRTLERRALETAPGYTAGRTDLDYLFPLARSWRASYVIAAGVFSPISVPVFQKGRYSVHAVPR